MQKRKFNIRKRIGALVLTFALVFGCIGIIPGSNGTIKAEAATPKLSATSITLTMGGSSKEVKLQNLSSKYSVTWSSSNSNIAKIASAKRTSSSVSTVTVKPGSKTGTATLKAKYNGKTYSCTVKNQKPTPKLNTTSTSLYVNGGTCTLKLSNIMSGTKVSWSSSNSSIARIYSSSVKTGSTGLYSTARIEPGHSGTATITAAYDGKKYQCTVKVYNNPKLSSSSVSLAYGGSTQIDVKNVSSADYSARLKAAGSLLDVRISLP